MPSLSGWWSGRSETERFDLYTRGSLYALLIGMVALVVIFGAAESPRNVPAAVAGVVLFAAATVIGMRAVGRGLDHALHGAPMPRGLLKAYLALAVLAGAAALVGYGPPAQGEPGTMAGGALIAVQIVAVVSPLLGWVKLAAVGVAMAAGLSALAGLMGAPYPSVSAIGMTVLFGTAGVIGGFRGSVWMLRIVWALERSQQVSADLAVAQERLRFARDMHDVMGRNLSVVAVRSELAAELARRGRSDDASREMLGVRAVAQESLREMRDVVRNYRTVDLAAELAGARSVLVAAGTTTRVIGDATELPTPVQSILAWVVREGTTNVIRHAEATTCTLRVGVDGDHATLSIENDGTLLSAAPGGTGLAGLTERLAAVGGDLTVTDDGPAGRFRITARVPLDAADTTPAAVANGARTEGARR